MRRGPKPAKSKEAKPTVARKSPKNEDSRVRDLEKRLAEAEEQQTATAEILRVISSSPGDLQPVLDAVAENAARVCGATDARILRVEGDKLRRVAQFGPLPAEMPALIPLSREFPPGRSIIDRRTLHIEDLRPLLDTEFSATRALRTADLGIRTMLVTPLMRENKSIGAILIRRTEVRPFTDKQIALLQTFADQAVIAIENVRLFRELQASNRELTTALDKQTATSDILRVISRSQMDVRPVFDAILASAIRLLNGYTGALTRREGDQITLAALTSTDDASDAAVKAAFPQRLHSRGAHPQTIRDRVPFNVADAHNDARLGVPEGAYASVRGYRSLVVVPLLRHDEAIGTVSVTRREPGGFTNDEIALLQTFADQAVIAIENVRLFRELQTRNRDLTEALDRQTATAEVLRVISSSPTDLQPVFDVITRSAVTLCGGVQGGLHLLEGELLLDTAAFNLRPEALDVFHRAFPMRLHRGSISARAIMDRAVQNVPDIEALTEYTLGEYARAAGFRSTLAVPMFREGVAIGVIVVARPQVGPFSEREVELLKTFASQAVIAIENVRLFKELEEKNRALTQAHAQVARHWSSRRRRARSSGSSASLRRTCSQCSMRSQNARFDSAVVSSAQSTGSMASSFTWWPITTTRPWPLSVRGNSFRRGLAAISSRRGRFSSVRSSSLPTCFLTRSGRLTTSRAPPASGAFSLFRCSAAMTRSAQSSSGTLMSGRSRKSTSRC